MLPLIINCKVAKGALLFAVIVCVSIKEPLSSIMKIGAKFCIGVKYFWNDIVGLCKLRVILSFDFRYVASRIIDGVLEAPICKSYFCTLKY